MTIGLINTIEITTKRFLAFNVIAFMRAKCFQQSFYYTIISNSKRNIDVLERPLCSLLLIAHSKQMFEVIE